MAKRGRSSSSASNKRYVNAALVVVAFLVIGLVLGPNAGQVYSGTSAVGADTLDFYNNGMLDTRVSYFSLTVPDAGVSAVGGTITRDGDYCVHTFTSSGTFEPLCDLDVEVLVVAGGGGGGSSTTACGGGGGGGAGGLLHDDSYAVTAQEYPVTVGAGGSGATVGLNNAANGGNSVFGTLTAIGGGYGAYGGSAGVGFNGGSGGSGGGGGWGQTTKGTGGAGTAGQGYAGGNANQPYGGGGGGASQVGYYGGSGAHGGDGLAYSISGTSTYYAGGGGGGSVGDGGLGGGGDGAGGAPGEDGTPNTGGGGGGAYAAGGSGGDGGSGIVIIRYLAPTSEVIDPGVSVGDEKLYYYGTLSSNWVFSDGVSYVDSVDVSTSVLGELPVIPVGTTQTIKIDQGLDYSVTYVPKSMSITSSGMFLPGEPIQIDTLLTDRDGNAASYQPAQMRVRLFEGDKQCLDDTVQSTSCIVPGSKLDTGHYQLRMSYYGFEFDGWSNEILADFDIGSGSTEIAVTSSPDPAPEGMFGGAAQSISGLLGTAASGWMNVPVISDILQWILDLLGVSL